MNPYATPPLITCIILTSIGTFVFLKNRSSKLNIIFSLFSFSMAVWLFGYTNMYLSQNPYVALKWARIGFLGIIFIPVFAYHFIISFLNLKRKIVLPLIYSLTIPSLVLSQTNLIYSGIKEHFWGYYPTAGKIYIFFLLMFAILFTRGVLLLFSRLKKESGIKKEQIKYVCLAFGLGTFGIVDYLIKYPIFNIYPFGYVCALFFNGLIAFAILRYRLLDINLALTRAGIFIIVYTFVLGIPFVIGYKYGLWHTATWFMLFLATLGPFFYTYLRRQAEETLLKDQRRYQEILKNLSKTMVNIRDLDELLKTNTSTIVDAVKVSFAAIYLKSSEYGSFQLKTYYPDSAKSRFQEFIPFDHTLINILNHQKRPLSNEEIGPQDKINLDSGLVIPCFGKDGLLSIIILGAKTNNKMYTNDDIFTFENFSYATSLAIENCTFWKEIEDRHRKARLQEMDAFSYSLAHEIDNPMTFVCNLARFLKEHFLKYITDPEERKEVEEMCNIIMEGSERVMGMVKAIRQFGQKTTGELEPLNLQEVIEGFFKLYSPELKANFIIFSKEMPDEIIYVKGVAAELQQVLMIFAKNAIHAMMYSQEKKIYLKVIKFNQSTVRIAVSDTGYGIKKENLHTIFEPFFTSKASTEGTGMGLHNAKGFVLRHQGRIWAESEGEGKGATFIFELPILQDVKPEDFKKKDSKTDWAY